MRAILTYHSIDGSGSPISVSAEVLRRHVAWLAERPIRVVSLQELLSADPARDAVAITFDDGFGNFAADAWPLLKAHGFPVTLFVPTGYVGGTNSWDNGPAPVVPRLPLLDWDDLGRLVDEGVSIGSHTASHLDLRDLHPDRLGEEIEGAAAELRRRLDVDVPAFAYPFGAWDRAARDAVQRVHATAVTTSLAPLPETDVDPLLLPRLDAYYYRTPGRLEAWGQASFRAHLAFRRAARLLRARLSG